MVGGTNPGRVSTTATTLTAPTQPSPALQRPSPALQQPSENGSTTDFSTIKPKPKHDTLHSLTQEWFGKGEYASLLPAGGLDALERKHKSKWRRHFDGREKRHFSRLQSKIKGLKNRAQGTNKDLDTIVDELAFAFKEEKGANKSLANFVRMLQHMGALEKRVRESRISQQVGGQ